MNTLFSLFLAVADNNEEAADSEEDDELGGLFKILKKKSERERPDHQAMNQPDSSRPGAGRLQDWDLQEVSHDACWYYSRLGNILTLLSVWASALYTGWKVGHCSLLSVTLVLWFRLKSIVKFQII